MIDFTKPIRTKGGLPVTIISIRGRGNHPVIGYIGEKATLYSWTPSGLVWVHGQGHENDLENVPDRIVRYLNMYEKVKFTSILHHSRLDANHDAGADRVACIRIEFEPGQFDD